MDADIHERFKGIEGHVGSLDNSVQDLTKAVTQQNLLSETRLTKVETEMAHVKEDVNDIDDSVDMAEKEIVAIKTKMKKKRNGSMYIYVLLAVAGIGFTGTVLAALLTIWGK